jgi:TolB protein
MRAPNRTATGLLVVWLLASILSIPGPSICQDIPPEVHLKLTEQGSARMGLGFQLLRGPEGTGEEGRQVADVVLRDLRFSLYFDVMELSEGVDTTARAFELFLAMGASALVRLRPQSHEDRNSVGLQIFDVPTREQAAGLEFVITDPVRVGHRIADEIVRVLTGSETIFGTRIAFSVADGETKEIALCDYDGGNLIRATSSGGLKMFPRWRDRRHLVYSAHDRSGMRLVALDFDRGEARTLERSEGFFVAGEFSTDGRTLACALSLGGNPEIHLMDVETREFRRLTVNRAVDISPTWSPSGREIAFVSDRTGSPQIYVMDRDGGNVRRLTYEGSYNSCPRWSPRGDLITYTSQVRGGRHQIFIMDPGGENPVQLTDRGSNEEPSWSPDGLHIAFSSDRGGAPELYMMHWDGSGQRRITSVGGAVHPDWSPP